MSKFLLKRVAATGGAMAAIGIAGALSLPAVAGAATTQPAVSHSVQAATGHRAASHWCYDWPWLVWCGHRWYDDDDYGYFDHDHGFFRGGFRHHGFRHEEFGRED